MKRIFFDFEVFKQLWLVVFIDYDTKEKTVIVNNPTQLREFYEAHKDDIWNGFNSRMYDQYILKAILFKIDPYYVSDQIINHDKKGYQIIRKADVFPINNFDVSTGFHGLKQLEGFLGNKIKESSVPFDIDRMLTKDEIKEVIEYCTHDVEQTIEVFNHSIEEFNSHLSLIEAFKLPMVLFNKTKAQLSAHVLGAIKQDHYHDEFDFIIPKNIVLSEKYQHVLDWYKNPLNMSYDCKLETVVANTPHFFGYGGVHGAINNYSTEGIILTTDVASLYPAIMINEHFLSRNVINPEKYKEIRDNRLKLKALKNPMQLPLKIVLNATFGASKDKNNSLYDPLMANNVCIAGQLFLLDLIEKIETHCTLIQSNTDGVFMKVDSLETVELIKSISKEWEQRTNLELEWEIFDKIYQKDVNNYIIINTETGKYKSKGAYVKKLKAIDYDLPIVNKALINYFVYNTPIEDTIYKCDNLHEFQKIVKVSSLFKYALHGDERTPEKTLRVFASNDPNAKGVFKAKEVNGEMEIQKIENTPERCFIYNDNVIEKPVPAELDKEFYVNWAKKRLNDFLIPEKVVDVKAQVQEMIGNCENFYNFCVALKEDKNVKCDSNKMLKYIKLGMFEQYGKSQKLINFIPYFKLLYSKKSPKKATVAKNIENVEIIKLIESHSIPTETAYSKFNSESCLIDILNILPNEEISYVEKIHVEIAETGNLTYVNPNIENNYLYVVHIHEGTIPLMIAYSPTTGIAQKIRIPKNIYKILPLRSGDLINAQGFELKHGKKVMGKNDKGINILVDDPENIQYWITTYEMIYRNYTADDDFDNDKEE